MRRMVIDYTERYYLPAADQGKLYHGEDFAVAKEMVKWRNTMRSQWQNVRVELSTLPSPTVTVGDPLQIQAKVWLYGIPATDVVVELVTGDQKSNGELAHSIVLPMTQMAQNSNVLTYAVTFTPDRSGPLAIGVRVRPIRPSQIHPIEPGLIQWA